MNAEYLHEFTGLQFMPVKANKMPIIRGWQTSSDIHPLSNCEAVGLVCGRLSDGLEVIDVDAKYSLDGLLFENYKKAVHREDPKLLEKLVVAKTKNGGYHLIYRCATISGNLKLANRPTTKEEKQITYNAMYEKMLSDSKPDVEAKAKAEKAAENDKVRVLLETRGEGGYIACHPTNGYELIHRDWYGIMEITPEERETLHSVARTFHSVKPEIEIPKTKSTVRTKGISPCDDYNERGDVVQLLQDHGWVVVSQKGQKTIFLRPGQTTSQTSGNYDHGKKWFSVFTTSSEFEPEKAYLPYNVFAVLECNKDISEATRRLYDLGFGERREDSKKEAAPSTRVIQSRVNTDDNDVSFLATSVDYDSYLDSVWDGSLVQGLPTHIPSLDKYFLLKRGEMINANGHANIGKSLIGWYIAMLSAMWHGWVWIIFSSENTLGGFMRKMIQFYWGKTIAPGPYQMTKEEYQIAKTFVEKHFKLIKSEENMYNYKDIINMIKKAKKIFQIDAGMIDPYNGLKIDLSGYSKLNTHEYHYEAISELKLYGKQENFGWWINHHAYTASARLKDGEKKYPVAPRAEDTEGGSRTNNKTDQFLSLHRITQHPTDWMVTEIHVRKVKDTETGGRPTPLDEPAKLEMYKGGCAFIERIDGFGHGIDPISEWHKRNGTIVNEAPTTIVRSTGELWTPYTDNNEEDPF